MMRSQRVLLLAQSESPSTTLIRNAFIEHGCTLTEVQYDLDGSVKQAVENSLPICGATAWKKDGKILTSQGDVYNPANFDFAILRSWGTAHYGASLLKLLEDSDVGLLHPTSASAIANSKVQSAEAFIETGIPFPETIIGHPSDLKAAFEKASEFLKRKGVLVYKSDYGTHGKGIRFISTFRELEDLRPDGKFLLQEFIGNPDKPISHYRVIVSAKESYQKALKLSAKEILRPSNFHAGGNKEQEVLGSQMQEVVQSAMQALGLNFAGVDIMKNEDGELVVLEVNDAPAVNVQGDNPAVAQMLVRQLVA